MKPGDLLSMAWDDIEWFVERGIKQRKAEAAAIEAAHKK